MISNKVQWTELAPSKRALSIDWEWLILICMLLASSGGIRYWRDWQFQSLLKESEVPPFALGEIPDVLGAWHAIEGSENTLEPEIARIAGASDHLIRTYVDEKSGQTATVMILYGLAYIVWCTHPKSAIRPLDLSLYRLHWTKTSISESPRSQRPRGFDCNISLSLRRGRQITERFTTRSRTPVNGDWIWRRIGSPFATTQGCLKFRCNVKLRALSRSTRVPCRNFLRESFRKLSSV